MSTWTDTPSPRRPAPDLRSDENSVRLLMVERSRALLDLLLTALGRAARGRFDVVWASCLDDAAESLREAAFDAVLVDVCVPGRGVPDVDAVSELASRLPVIALAGTGEPELVEELAEDDGFEACLGRVGRADLPATILRAVHRHRRLGALGAEPTICRIPSD